MFSLLKSGLYVAVMAVLIIYIKYEIRNLHFQYKNNVLSPIDMGGGGGGGGYYGRGDGKKPSQNGISGENPSRENPSKVSCGENPSPYFGA